MCSSDLREQINSEILRQFLQEKIGQQKFQEIAQKRTTIAHIGKTLGLTVNSETDPHKIGEEVAGMINPKTLDNQVLAEGLKRLSETKVRISPNITEEQWNSLKKDLELNEFDIRSNNKFERYYTIISN